MLGVLLSMAAVATPQPSPSPLKTITHLHSTPFCTAFENNIKHGVEGVLLNDDLFKRTEPVFLKAAHDMVSGGFLESSFNSTRPAQPNPDNAAVQLDMDRMSTIAGAIVKNLETIDKLLNDPTRFPKQPATADDKQIVQLRAKLLALAKQQNDELNILSGTTEQYLFDSLYNADVSAGGALSSTGSAPATARYFGGGPLNAPPGSAATAPPGPTVNKTATTMPRPSNANPFAGDPRLLQNDIFMNSQMGQLYKELLVREAQEATMEPIVAQALVEASAGCK